MATPADQRLLELLEKWLSSLELHAKYSSLDDDSYSRIQPWPEHQRPSRWIIDLAKQKALALQAQVQERIKTGDAKFSDSLELMTFLANLVGSEHIERYIPLADADNERSLSSQAEGRQTPDGQPPAPPSVSATATREMPKFVVEKQRTAAPAATANVARTERKAAEVKAAAKVAVKLPAKPAASGKAAKPAAASTAKGAAAPAANHTAASAASPGAARSGSTYDKSGPSEAAREQVIADATRLVQWGRKWYELAELIASMADRPHLTDVRRILKDNKAVIDKKAGRG